MCVCLWLWWVPLQCSNWFGYKHWRAKPQVWGPPVELISFHKSFKTWMPPPRTHITHHSLKRIKRKTRQPSEVCVYLMPFCFTDSLIDFCNIQTGRCVCVTEGTGIRLFRVPRAVRKTHGVTSLTVSCCWWWLETAWEGGQTLLKGTGWPENKASGQRERLTHRERRAVYSEKVTTL